MVEGEAMRKKDLEKRFDTIWNELCKLQMDKVSVNSTSSAQFLRDNIRGIEVALRKAIDEQGRLVATLIEAGILAERKEGSMEYVQFEDKQYTIRKVK